MSEFVYSTNYENYVRTRLDKFFDLYEYKFRKCAPLFICIGTPNVIGDALGPKIGTNLSMLGYSVMGTLESPTARKECITLAKQFETFNPAKYRPTMGIDASVAKTENFGSIGCSIEHGITPAAGIDKTLNLKPLGESCIHVCVGTSLNDIIKASEYEITHIANIVSESIHRNMVGRGMI